MSNLKDLNDFADLLKGVKLIIEENPEDFPHYYTKPPRRLRKVSCTGYVTEDWRSGAKEFECGYGAEFDCYDCCCNGGHLDPRLINESNNKVNELIRTRASRRFSIRKY